MKSIIFFSTEIRCRKIVTVLIKVCLLAGVCDFSPHDKSFHNTFSLNSDPIHNRNPIPNPNLNTNPNTNPNPNSPVAVTCIKIKGCEMKCREVNCPIPLASYEIKSHHQLCNLIVLKIFKLIKP